MNEIFNIDRFKATLGRGLRLNLKSISISLGAMAGAMAFFVLIENGLAHVESAAHTRIMLNSLYSTFCVVFVIASIILASSFGRGNDTPGRRLNELMVPASTCEKFATRFVLSIIIPMAGLCIAWTVVDLMRCGACSLYYGAERTVGPAWFWDALGAHLDGKDWLLMLAAQAFFALGSMIWFKSPIIKTILAGWIIQMLIGAVAFISGYAAIYLFHLTHTKVRIAESTFEQFSFFGPGAFWAGGVCLILFFYAMAYMRLGEEEIINRN